ncbi:hypothetical protein GCM10023231_29350 [Olivibacter ginsenosidimutans]|uniref:Uncharacterized protein n=1 Tax=Olivibacter ginsenosidimutans TaxID=1176537 RepID=A0ABP9BQ67_9SPHI
MVKVVGVIGFELGLVQSVDFEQEMVVAVPRLQTKYVTYIKRVRGKIKTFSAFKVF